jgi:uncharacterized membrane protein
MHYEVSVDIDAPGERVWAVLNDVVRWSQWSPTIEEIRLLEDKPFEVGSKARVKQPKMNAMIWQVTESEPGRSFVWQTKGPGFLIVAGHYIDTKSSGPYPVRLTLDLSGPLSPVLSMISGKRIRQYVDTEGASLKKRCESPVGENQAG